VRRRFDIPPAIVVAGLLGPPTRRLAHVAQDLGVSQRQVVAALIGAVEQLPPAESLVLTERLGLRTGRPTPLSEIAGELGVQPQRVRLLEVSGLRRLQGGSPERTESLS
jgi:DNA-directed RNA polymerase sigma subunit (sigma70/sigma32)